MARQLLILALASLPVAARTSPLASANGDSGVDVSANGGSTAFSTAVETASMTVSAVNDAPLFSNLDGSASFTEGGSPVVLDSDATITDVELSGANDFSGATLTLARNGGAVAEDNIAFDGVIVTTSGGNVYVSGVQVGNYVFSGGQMSILFNSSATQARVDTLIQHIVYWNSSDAPPASVQLDWTVGDNNIGAQGSGGVLQATGSTTVNITAVNDAPVLVAPAAASAIDSTEYYFNAGQPSEISVGDPDATILDVTINVSSGTFTLNGTTGLTFITGDGYFDQAVRFTGTAADINAAFAGAYYLNSLGHGPTETITILVDDQGQSGTGGAQSAASAINVSITSPGGVATDGFLAGSFLEVGLGTDGALGSDGAAPVGFKDAGSLLGAVVDNERDGWSTYDGDYVLPGTPVETWGVQVGGTDYDNGNSVGTDISGSLSGFQSGPSGQSIEWLGSKSGLDIRQIYSVGSNSLYLDVEVQLTNVSGRAMSDVYYFRNIDPDNNYYQGSPDSFFTTNSIVSQGNAGSIIYRCDLNGSNLSAWITGLSGPYGMKLDSSTGRMYFCAYAVNNIQRVSARPMISGTAMAPAYITRTCWMPRTARRGNGKISSTEWAAGESAADDIFEFPLLPAYFRNGSGRVFSIVLLRHQELLENLARFS